MELHLARQIAVRLICLPHFWRALGVIDPHTGQSTQDSEGISEHPNRSS
jgi:hypothetical protein